jgi:hypothetical protein
VLDERAGAAGRLAEAGGAWRPGGWRRRAVGERAWAAARLLQPMVGATVGDAVRAPAAGWERRLAWGPAAAGGEEGGADGQRWTPDGVGWEQPGGCGWEGREKKNWLWYQVRMETLTLTGVGWCINRLEYWARPITEGRDSNYIGENPKP